MNQMDVQQAADLSIEVHLAALNARSEQRAWVDVENPSGQSKTIRMQEPPNTDIITNLHLCHSSRSQQNRYKTEIIGLWTLVSKEFSARTSGGGTTRKLSFTSFYHGKNSTTV